MTASQEKFRFLFLLLFVTTVGFTTASCSSAGADKGSSSDAVAADDSADIQLDEGDSSSKQLAADELSSDAKPKSDAKPETSTANGSPLPDPDDIKLDEDEPQAPAPKAAQESPAVPAPAPDAPPPIEAAAPVIEPTISNVNVTDLRFVPKQGGGDVVIETSGPATYHTSEVPTQNQMIVEISNARLPANLKHPSVPHGGNQAISSINAYQDSGSSMVRVVIQYKTATRTEVNQSGGKITVASSGPAPSEEPVLANAPEQESRSGNELNEVKILSTSASADVQVSNEPRKFYGKPISIEVRDTPVREVINLIAEQSGANIVLSGDADGNISLKLRQIPWDEALFMVMKTRNLGYVRQGSILRILPNDSLEKENESTRKIFEADRAARPLSIKVINVSYAKVIELEKQVKPFLTKERGNIVADPRTNSLVVTDTPDVLLRVDALIRALDLQPLQVLIEGKVVEASEIFARNFGINWGAANGQPMAIGGQSLTNNGISVNTVNPLPPGGGNIGFKLGTFDFFGDLTASLALAENDSLAHIVSSPRVVVLNNEKANIVQGTNVPIQSTTIAGGVPVVTTTYQSIEMRMEVTPQVTSSTDVLLNLDIKREFQSAPGVNGGAPSIDKREAITKVLVRSGQTAVIGGVYQNDTIDTEGGVPWLREIPVLGWLFKTQQKQKTKNELLVFLTPRILNAEASAKGSSL
jgi:type IV pilus assembly protein PilQ